MCNAYGDNIVSVIKHFRRAKCKKLVNVLALINL